MVRVVDQVVLVLSVLLQVVEGNGVSLDANFFDKLAELTISTLTQVSEQTVLELGALLHAGVGW